MNPDSTLSDPANLGGALRSLGDDEGRALPASPEERLEQFRSRKRRRRTTQFGAAALAAVVLVGGGVALAGTWGSVTVQPADSVPADVLANALEVTRQTGSARFTGVTTDSRRDDEFPNRQISDGAISFADSTATAVRRDPGNGRTVEWMRFPDSVLARFVGDPMPAGKTWRRYDRATGEALFGESDPSGALEWLARATAPRVIGTEQIGGDSATHYTASITTRQLLQGRGSYRVAVDMAAGDEGQGMDDPVTIDVWVDDRSRVRRITAPERQGIGIAAGVEVLRFEFTGFGAPVTVERPPADRVMPVESIVEGTG